jgi:DeoR/GlpR family transcriptional regulator of sugar metabolism
MRARELETLEIIRERQPVAMADVAYRLGVDASTAKTYLHQLHLAGLITPSSRGRWARWRTTPPPPPPPADQEALQRAIEQAASVWHYAQRIAVISGAQA